MHSLGRRPAPVERARARPRGLRSVAASCSSTDRQPRRAGSTTGEFSMSGTRRSYELFAKRQNPLNCVLNQCCSATVARMSQSAFHGEGAAGDSGRRHDRSHDDSAANDLGSAQNLQGDVAAGSQAAPPDTDSQARDIVDIAVIDRHVIQLFALVENAVAGATHALVSADREAARNLVAADAEIDALYQQLEAAVQGHLLARPSPAEETEYLLAVLGMLPELERSGDLAEHVARRATRNLPAEMPARLRGYVQRMGEVACAMWHIAGDAFCGDVPSAPQRLEALDDEMDDLHLTFIAELVSAGIAVDVAIELALVGRFYERLGDHAVNLARRVPRRPRSDPS